jgi:ABC-type uncharacterized transport system permease subunit
MGIVILRGGANQISVGIAITLLGRGLANYLFQIWQPSRRSAVIVPLAPAVHVPLLERLPLVRQALFAQSPSPTSSCLLSLPPPGGCADPSLESYCVQRVMISGVRSCVA